MTDRQTKKQTDMYANMQEDKQANSEKGRQIEKQTDGRTYTLKDKQAGQTAERRAQ